MENSEIIIKQLRSYQRTVEADLELAQIVYRSMIPQNQIREAIEVVCDCIPMIGIGGDYASVYFKDARQVVATISDVCGHGIAAALLANRVNAFVLSHIDTVHHPCELIEKLNAFIYKHFSSSELFLTFFCVWINLEEQYLMYAGCGHPPVLLYSQQQQKCIHLASENTLIGIFPELIDTCSMERIPFTPGDRLLLYTDGISEAKNGKDEFLGVSGLQTLFQQSIQTSPQQNMASIVAGVNSFRESTPAKDDQFLLSLSYHDTCSP